MFDIMAHWAENIYIFLYKNICDTILYILIPHRQNSKTNRPDNIVQYWSELFLRNLTIIFKARLFKAGQSYLL